MIAVASISRVPVSFSSDSCQGSLWPEAIIEEFGTRLFAAVNGARREVALVAGDFTQRSLKLKLQNSGEEVTCVRDVAWDVVLRTRIEIILAAFVWRCYALILQA